MADAHQGDDIAFAGRERVERGAPVRACGALRGNRDALDVGDSGRRAMNGVGEELERVHGMRGRGRRHVRWSYATRIAS